MLEGKLGDLQKMLARLAAGLGAAPVDEGIVSQA